MTRTLCVAAALAGLLFANSVKAQEEKKEEKHGIKHKSITISNKGIKVKNIDSNQTTVGEIKDKDDDGRRFTTSLAMVDLGINILQDNTNYLTNADAQNYLAGVPAHMRNTTLFDLKVAKSINVNIYPWMIKFAAVKTQRQRIYISSGIGLQLYNFRYENNLTYTRNPNGILLDSAANLSKDKLGLDYLNIPLMFTFKTRLFKDRWLVYGVGVTEGLRIASWNKQKSDAHGKVKIHDDFGLADWNTCLTGEFGIEGIVRFYASYQLTSLYDKGLDQHPISFGFRFSGI
jgi:hypothetical protein